MHITISPFIARLLDLVKQNTTLRSRHQSEVFNCAWRYTVRVGNASYQKNEVFRQRRQGRHFGTLECQTA